MCVIFFFLSLRDRVRDFFGVLVDLEVNKTKWNLGQKLPIIEVVLKPRESEGS